MPVLSASFACVRPAMLRRSVRVCSDFGTAKKCSGSNPIAAAARLKEFTSGRHSPLSQR